MARKKIETSLDELRAITKSLYDIQDMRMRIAGRLERKADETPMRDNGSEALASPEGFWVLQDLYIQVREVEHKFELAQKSAVECTPEWRLFLKDVKGVGPKMAAVLITEIDIEKAENAAKIWQFAGLNPGLVRGKKRIGDKIVVTDDMIRGDRLTAGYLAPYNQYLKTKVVGVLADSFIKSKSPYAKFYYDYKHRLENSREITGDKGKMWSEVSAAHRDRAAKRYMSKLFLRDYYVAVRTMHNFSVRKPYEEEYLDIVHHA